PIYGVNFADPDMERDRSAFSKLLRACGQIEGLERVRFTSPHPAEFTDDVIDAMAETPNVVHQLHMPLQSGSDRVLKDMRRSYRTKKFLGILEEVREKMPDAAITTDIIVGFPGETEEDFQQTLDVVEKARFSSAFTFQYSPRPGTPAATMADQVPPEGVKERYCRLLALQERISEEENAKLVGSEVELLVSQSDGRKNAETHRMSGRSRDGRLVHFSPSESEPGVVDRKIRPGDYVTVRVTDSAPHFLIADSGVLTHRRTKAGDNVEVGQIPTTAPIGVGLGLPKIGRPEKTKVSEGCGCE
ncbi:MiaB/RimO family radical SAM methylthiotransferase, partial [Corynebacterium amycolatum]|uniref:MiaB/RimO family radical SAM methylthiotransferase n=1 Tax=Corynebacterium amycolatum TaxID=43765 RepID=UPI00211A7CEF